MNPMAVPTGMAARLSKAKRLLTKRSSFIAKPV